MENRYTCPMTEAGTMQWSIVSSEVLLGQGVRRRGGERKKR
jgi:hypothetical protein